MERNAQLSATESKNKQANKQNRNRIIDMKIIWRGGGYQLREGGRGMREKVQGIRYIMGKYKLDRGRLRIV